MKSMKSKIICLLVSTFVLLSCSNDDSDTELNPKDDFPTTAEIADTPLEKGSILTITGNFNPEKTYTVTFFENIIAENIEVNTDKLMVEIPSDAKSGEVTLTFEGETKTIGKVEIIENSTKDIFIFQYDDDVKKLAKIDTNTGDLEYITSKIEYGTNTRGMVYNPNNKTFVGFDFDADYKPFVITINPDGTTTSTKIKEEFLAGGGNFDDLVIDDQGNYFIFQYDEDVKKLAKLNTTTGDLEYVTPKIEYGTNTRGMVYNPNNKTFVGFDFDADYKPFVITINPDGTTTSTKIKEEFLAGGGNFDDLVIDDQGNCYIFQYDEDVKKLAKINTATGSLEYVTSKLEYGTNTRGMVYNPSNKTFVGFDFDSDFKPFVITINLNGTTTTTYIKEEFLASGGNFTDLVIN